MGRGGDRGHRASGRASRTALRPPAAPQAKPVTARLMSLGAAGQTLLSRAAFDLARRAAADEPAFAEQLRWLAHGSYLMKGIEDPVEVYEWHEAQHRS